MNWRKLGFAMLTATVSLVAILFVLGTIGYLIILIFTYFSGWTIFLSAAVLTILGFMTAGFYNDVDFMKDKV